MAIGNATVTVTDTATQIVANAPDNNINRLHLLVTNTDANNSVRLGIDNTVTFANGFPLNTNDVFEVSGLRVFQGALWGICDTGLTADVRVLELG